MKRKKNIKISAKKHEKRGFPFGWLLLSIILILLFAAFILLGLALGEYAESSMLVFYIPVT